MIPAEQIATLCDVLERSPRDERGALYVEALRALAIAKEPSARRRITAAIESNDKYIRTRAPEALLALEGLEDARVTAFAQMGGDYSLAKLPDAMRAYIAVLMFKGEVDNGGFEQYFANSTGIQWRDALDGLRTIGGAKTHAIFVEVLSFFPQSEPASDRAGRVAQMNQWTDTQAKRLRQLEDQFYEEPDNLERLLAEHVIKHRGLFLKGASTRPANQQPL